MQRADVVLAGIKQDVLHQQLIGLLPGKFIGVSTFGSGPVALWMDDSAVQADIDLATTTALAHDPIFLSIDKTTINADGIDTATLTVMVTKVNAAAVIITINGVDYLLAFTNGVATVQINSADPGTFVISVKNPTNRINNGAINVLAV